MKTTLVAVLLLISAVTAYSQATKSASKPMTANASSGTQVATFGSGCFWCTEAIFQNLDGVTKVVSGYSGGKVKNPTYKEVCTGTTGHAEVIQVTLIPLRLRMTNYSKYSGKRMTQLRSTDKVMTRVHSTVRLFSITTINKRN
jgi:peptide-methionine (S)-S-oxide reductase